MGQYDAPLKQEQPIFYLNPYSDNIAVYGGPQTGKTTFVKTMLLRLSEQYNERPYNHIYIMDFGDNIGNYADLPNVCACFNGTNEENIKRIFKTIDSRLDENAKALKGRNYQEISKDDVTNCPNHIILIIDNVNALWDDAGFALYQDKLIHLCRDGLSKGLSVVVTINDTTGLSRLLAYFRQKIVFEMPSDNYFDIFNSKVTKPMKIPGRGIVNINDSTYEFQCFLPFATVKEEKESLAKLSRVDKIYGDKYKLISFPSTLNDLNYLDYTDSADAFEENDVVLGVDYYDHIPLSINIFNDALIAIYGNKTYERINILMKISSFIAEKHPEIRVVLLDDGRKELIKVKDYLDSNGKVSVNYLSTLKEFDGFLDMYGYTNEIRSEAKEISIDNAFTVFIVQSKPFFSTNTFLRNTVHNKLPAIVADSHNKKCCFIFSDTKSITDAEYNLDFVGCITKAILLDNIGDFVADRGKRSVFGDMDPRELKSMYARCSDGDAFFYDVESDDLRKGKIVE